MAFFKFRKGGDESPAAAPHAESVEVVRRRARQRLIGAAVLVLIGVVGFPLLFDTQPRPVAVDIPIEIPDRNKARPLPPPQPAPRAETASQPAVQAARAASAPARPVASGVVAAAPAAEVSRPSTPEARPASAPVADSSKPAATAAAASQPAAGSQPAASARAETPAKRPPADAARAQALLEGKTVEVSSAASGEGRFVVQVGAFSDEAKAKQTQQKVARAGLKNYVHEATTRDGKVIRVRAGPFATRSEADKAAERLKELDLPVRLLTLP